MFEFDETDRNAEASEFLRTLRAALAFLNDAELATLANGLAHKDASYLLTRFKKHVPIEMRVGGILARQLVPDAHQPGTMPLATLVLAGAVALAKSGGKMSSADVQQALQAAGLPADAPAVFDTPFSGPANDLLVRMTGLRIIDVVGGITSVVFVSPVIPSLLSATFRRWQTLQYGLPPFMNAAYPYGTRPGSSGQGEGGLVGPPSLPGDEQ